MADECRLELGRPGVTVIDARWQLTPRLHNKLPQNLVA